MRGRANTRSKWVRCRGELTQGEQGDASQCHEQAD